MTTEGSISVNMCAQPVTHQILNLIPTDRVPAVDMTDWHVARQWPTGQRCQNGVDV